MVEVGLYLRFAFTVLLVATTDDLVVGVVDEELVGIAGFIPFFIGFSNELISLAIYRESIQSMLCGGYYLHLDTRRLVVLGSRH